MKTRVPKAREANCPFMKFFFQRVSFLQLLKYTYTFLPHINCFSMLSFISDSIYAEIQNWIKCEEVLNF